MDRSRSGPEEDRIDADPPPHGSVESRDRRVVA
jgi:hypothetical protein